MSDCWAQRRCYAPPVSRTSRLPQPGKPPMRTIWLRCSGAHSYRKSVALFYYHSHSNPSYIIYKLKYHHRPDTGNYLGRLIASKGIESDFFKDIDAIIPIPITKSRRKTRGYNQSEEIARGIQERTHLPIITDAIRRVTFTESQTQRTDGNDWKRKACIPAIRYLSRQRRQTSHHRSAGKHLLIVDDVCTTGATLISCCEELQKAGKMKFSIATIGWAAE